MNVCVVAGAKLHRLLSYSSFLNAFFWCFLNPIFNSLKTWILKVNYFPLPGPLQRRGWRNGQKLWMSLYKWTCSFEIHTLCPFLQLTLSICILEKVIGHYHKNKSKRFKPVKMIYPLPYIHRRTMLFYSMPCIRYHNIHQNNKKLLIT